LADIATHMYIPGQASNWVKVCSRGNLFCSYWQNILFW